MQIDTIKELQVVPTPMRCFSASELAPVPDMTPMAWAAGGLVVASLALLAAAALLVLQRRNEKTKNSAPPPPMSKVARRRHRLFHSATTGPRAANLDPPPDEPIKQETVPNAPKKQAPDRNTAKSPFDTHRG